MSLQLVFSDEFETEGQQLNVAAGNKRWTAEQLHYGATQDIEVYLPEQVGCGCTAVQTSIAAGHPGFAGWLAGCSCAWLVLPGEVGW